MLIDRFKDTLDFWRKAVNQYDLNSLLKKPDETSWSLGQLYLHLVEETYWYFGQLESSLGNEDNLEKEMTNEAKRIFQNNSFPDVRIIGDPLISDNIKQPESVRELVLLLDKLSDDASRLWEKIEISTISGKSQHPGLQYFSPKEWFQYAEMHLRHHFKQKARIDEFLNQIKQ